MLAPIQQWLLFLAALSGFIAVSIGAFAAHALKQRISPEMLAIFEVGVRYHMYHALAIGLAVWISTVSASSLPIVAGWTFFAGIVIFSGSLYTLALTSVKAWGAVTPIGGLLMLIGWACLAIAAFSPKAL
jgi:uncharacterized membrane protein YgdD (TMEM256/DUF423 family)